MDLERSTLTRGSVEWPALDPKAKSPWLWSRTHDLLWIAGGASLLFALVAVPVTLLVPGATDLLLTAFLHLVVLCNYPHYAVTYQLIARERARAPSSFFWLVASTPIALAAIVLGVVQPQVIPLVTRIYLTWSAYHYAAQHFGLASMYQAKTGAPLLGGEKRAVQIGFVGVSVHLMVLINMEGGLGYGAFGVTANAIGARLLPASAYPIAAAVAALSCAAFAIGARSYRTRTGGGLSLPAKLLFATNFAWFVVPFVQIPGRPGPWTGAAVATWVPFALPFFHCAQYLGVCGWRARTTGSIRPIYWFMALVFLGLFLFEASSRALPFASRLTSDQAFLLVPAVVNIHHFFLDGLMWKTRRRPASPNVAVVAQ